MKKHVLTFTGLVLAAAAANAQPAEGPANDHAAPHADGASPADHAAGPATPADAAQAPAEPAIPADAATPAIVAADVSEAEIDSFAKATVKLQEIQADATIAADEKQAAMTAAVAAAGLDPVTYNAIGKAAQADPALRAKVQTAMTRHAAPPSDG